MLIRHSGFQKIVALLGLCAVLLGALEHEDLILQETPENPAGLDARGLFGGERAAVVVAGDVVEVAADSGTEGTFRSEDYRFWLSPRQRARYARLPTEARPAWRRAARAGGDVAAGWPARRGIVALRL